MKETITYSHQDPTTDFNTTSTNIIKVSGIVPFQDSHNMQFLEKQTQVCWVQLTLTQMLAIFTSYVTITNSTP